MQNKNPIKKSYLKIEIQIEYHIEKRKRKTNTVTNCMKIVSKKVLKLLLFT